MSDLLTSDSSACLAPLGNLHAVLSDECVVPASINVEWRHTDRTHPYLNVWFRYRTDLQRVAKRLGLGVETRKRTTDQRHYFTKGDGPGALLQCISYPHHDDWETT